MKKLLDILNENYFQSIILILTVVVTIIIYYWQRRSARCDAARVIVMQIDSVNQKTDSLIRCFGANVKFFDVAKFWKSDDVIEKNEWEKYRHLFINLLNYNEICALNNYYDNVVSIVKQQQEIKNVISNASKSNSFHNRAADDPKSNINVPTLYFTTIQMQYEKIVNSRMTVPYERLKKIAKM